MNCLSGTSYADLGIAAFPSSEGGEAWAFENKVQVDLARVIDSDTVMATASQFSFVHRGALLLSAVYTRIGELKCEDPVSPTLRELLYYERYSLNSLISCASAQ